VLHATPEQPRPGRGMGVGDFRAGLQRVAAAPPIA
jgi:hypothetical protein